jgi:hypothetical protein
MEDHAEHEREGANGVERVQTIVGRHGCFLENRNQT